MGDVMALALRDPLVVIGATFMLGLLVMAGVLLVTNSKRWHLRRHAARGVSTFGCDHCWRDRQEYQDSLRRGAS